MFGLCIRFKRPSIIRKKTISFFNSRFVAGKTLPKNWHRLISTSHLQRVPNLWLGGTFQKNKKTKLFRLKRLAFRALKIGFHIWLVMFCVKHLSISCDTFLNFCKQSSSVWLKQNLVFFSASLIKIKTIKLTARGINGIKCARSAQSFERATTNGVVTSVSFVE